MSGWWTVNIASYGNSMYDGNKSYQALMID